MQQRNTTQTDKHEVTVQADGNITISNKESNISSYKVRITLSLGLTSAHDCLITKPATSSYTVLFASTEMTNKKNRQALFNMKKELQLIYK
ncbi:Uncharacterized protein TSPI_05854 [Trichinella spiralis]|uniref:Retrovirus-related Pol polyprotein from transposon TNT 1-94 n=1 Tax=Trichinella spiralis TaxID=6334 RepID=A0ABR3KIJ3_TRISP